MKQPTSKKLFDYWNTVRGARIAPRRFEIEPSHIADILPETFIAEHISGAEYNFRLAGTRIGFNLGRDLKGENLLSFWTEKDAEAVQNLLHCVVEDAGVGSISFSAEGAKDEAFDFEMTLLPLVHSDQKINRFLGAITPKTPSHSLSGARLTNFQIRSIDILWPDFFPEFMLREGLVVEPEVLSQGYSRIVRSERRCFRVYDGGRKDAVS